MDPGEILALGVEDRRDLFRITSAKVEVFFSLRAHNEDLARILATDLVKRLRERAATRESAYTEAYVAAAFALQKALEAGRPVEDGFRESAEIGLAVFVRRGVAPLSREDAWVFLGAADLDLRDAAIGRVREEDIAMLRAVRDLSRLEPLLGRDLFRRIKRASRREFPPILARAGARVGKWLGLAGLTAVGSLVYPFIRIER